MRGRRENYNCVFKKKLSSAYVAKTLLVKNTNVPAPEKLNTTCHGVNPSLLQNKATYILWSKYTLPCALLFLALSWAKLSRCPSQEQGIQWVSGYGTWSWASCYKSGHEEPACNTFQVLSKSHLSRLVHFQVSGFSDPHQPRMQPFSFGSILHLK